MRYISEAGGKRVCVPAKQRGIECCEADARRDFVRTKVGIRCKVVLLVGRVLEESECFTINWFAL